MIAVNRRGSVVRRSLGYRSRRVQYPALVSLGGDSALARLPVTLFPVTQ